MIGNHFHLFMLVPAFPRTNYLINRHTWTAQEIINIVIPANMSL
jgi:hypothetical protein